MRTLAVVAMMLIAGPSFADSRKPEEVLEEYVGQAQVAAACFGLGLVTGEAADVKLNAAVKYSDRMGFMLDPREKVNAGIPIILMFLARNSNARTLCSTTMDIKIKE